MPSEDASVSHHPFRWLRAQALGGAFLTTLIATLCRRAMKPSMPRVSEQWLVSHENEYHRH